MHLLHLMCRNHVTLLNSMICWSCFVFDPMEWVSLGSVLPNSSILLNLQVRISVLNYSRHFSPYLVHFEHILGELFNSLSPYGISRIDLVTLPRGDHKNVVGQNNGFGGIRGLWPSIKIKQGFQMSTWL